MVRQTGNRGDLLLRRATNNDAELLWHWANDPVTRANSFDPVPIPWAVHRSWFAKRMASADCRIWILEFQNKPVAQIRYDRIDSETARISYSVDEKVRGQGFGIAALELSLPLAMRDFCVQCVTGVTFRENLASCQAFLKAGFELVDEPTLVGHACVVFRRRSTNSGNGDRCAAHN